MIDCMVGSANSTLDCDAMETTAVKNVFGGRAGKIPISSIKSMIGECFSASGALNIAGCLGMLENGFIPPTINYRTPDRRCDLDYVPNESRSAEVGRVVMNAFSPTGPNSALVIGRYDGS